MGVVDDLARAREAYERHEWVAAYERLADVDRTTTWRARTSHDWRSTALLLRRVNDAVQAWQRAYQAYLDVGDALGAVRCAFELAMLLLQNGEAAVASGWLGRCQRLLSDVSGDVVERGYVLTIVVLQHVFSGRHESGMPLAVQVADYGRRFSEPDLVAMGLNMQGGC